MSDVPLPLSPSPSVSSIKVPDSTRSDYRGKCLYKTGKCMNERALKTSGAAHNLCDEHRNRQNQHQRKLDAKNRLHKRERRVFTEATNSGRYEPYPAVVNHATLRTSANTSDKAESVASTASPLQAIAAVRVEDEKRIPSSSESVATTTSTGVVFLPNGPQPPQLSIPFVMQGFDGIVVPLPSYLEGQERIDFRSRIYQKVLDFISEECILRFGDRTAISTSFSGAAEAKPTLEAGTARLQTEQLKCSNNGSADENIVKSKVSDVQQSSASPNDGSRSSRTKKRAFDR